jgi:Flagellar motor switch/type III secretory pathway protein
MDSPEGTHNGVFYLLVEEPVDIKVNGKLVAKGELVVVEEKFGVKITDIVEREERVKRAL